MNKFWLILPALIAINVSIAFADQAPGTRDGVFQIVKVTDSRVWRLNTQTGEIAVCDLSGENLVCTTSANVADVPKRSYAEIEAEREAAAKAATDKQQAERTTELKFLDKILAMVRELIQKAIGEATGI
jgi:hypothetical protein